MENNLITVVLPIEVKGREFDSRLLLAYHLVKQGYNVVIGDRAGVERETKYTQNCIYIAKSLAYSQQEMYENFHSNNGKVLILYEEGAYVGRLKNLKSELDSSYPRGMIPHIDAILVYGNAFKSILIDNIEELDNTNVYVIGNPRFDLHKRKYFSYFDDQISNITNKFGKYILFNGNFVRGNHHLGQKHLLNEIKENQELTNEAKSIFYKMMEESEEQLNSFINMISCVAKKNPKITLIVRPHPGEGLSIYQKSLSNFENIRIINEGSAYPWIIGSELVVHQDCTTAIETIFSEKPVISFYPFDDRTNLFALSTYLSDKTSSIDEIIQKIDFYLKNPYKLRKEQIEKINSEVINYSDFSHFKLNDVISKIKKNMVYDKFFKNDMKKIINLWYQRFRAYLRWMKGKYLVKTGYAIAFEGLNINELKKRIKNIKSIEEDSLADIKVSQKGINVFHLSRTDK